ncbi:hypothetical protein NL676_030619 [Syzygium grande]|nr:hypothetical protein NL676_030619 [Syzygium grande]
MKRIDLLKLATRGVVWKDGSLMAEILKQIEILWVEECSSLSIVFPPSASFPEIDALRSRGLRFSSYGDLLGKGKSGAPYLANPKKLWCNGRRGNK